MISLAAREGTAIPGTSLQYSSFFNRSIFQVNSEGLYGIAGKVDEAGITSDNDGANWVGTAGGAAGLVFREGDAAPGTSAGELLGSIGTPRINASGNVAFQTGLTGAGIEPGADAIYSGPPTPGNLSLLLRTGDPAPGVEPGSTFGTSIALFQFNDDGDIGFRARLTGPNVPDESDDGFWTKAAGQQPRLIVREGDPAPGTDAGVTFASIDNSTFAFVDPATVFFSAKVEGPGVASPVNEGLWYGTADDLRLVGFRGDTFPAVFRFGKFSFLSNSSGTAVFHGGGDHGHDELWVFTPPGR